MAVTELVASFFDAEPGLTDNLTIAAICTVLAAVPLLLGAWASPGDRWREAGLTILIAAAIGALCGVSVIMIFNDPTARPYLPTEMPKIAFAPLLGAVNLLIVAALGWWLQRGRATD